MRTVGPRLAAGLLAALVLGGCGGSPEPRPLPKPTTSPSPSPSATPTPPVLPQAAKAKTKAGAIAFARTFIETLNYSGRHGRYGSLCESSTSHCCTRCEATG